MLKLSTSRGSRTTSGMAGQRAHHQHFRGRATQPVLWPHRGGKKMERAINPAPVSVALVPTIMKCLERLILLHFTAALIPPWSPTSTHRWCYLHCPQCRTAQPGTMQDICKAAVHGPQFYIYYHLTQQAVLQDVLPRCTTQQEPYRVACWPCSSTPPVNHKNYTKY